MGGSVVIEGFSVGLGENFFGVEGLKERYVLGGREGKRWGRGREEGEGGGEVRKRLL